jgi:hypothetical protein
LHSVYIQKNGGTDTKAMGQTEPQFLSEPMSDRKKKFSAISAYHHQGCQFESVLDTTLLVNFCPLGPIGLTNFKNSEVNQKLTLMYNIRNVIGPLDTDCWLYLPYHLFESVLDTTLCDKVCQ